MHLLVSSLADEASINIRDGLLELGGWKGIGNFCGREVMERNGMIMVTIEGLHLYADHIERSVMDAIDVPPFDDILFLSRHASASGRPSLTVHPIGNFGKAEHGGMPETLVPASPDLMTSMLRRIGVEAKGLNFEVTFEVTHHGPITEVPTLFVEIGSDPSTWNDKSAAKAIASSILGTDITSYPKAIGIGGGHYATRFTEVCMRRKVSFGHMIPNYQIDIGDRRSHEKEDSYGTGEELGGPCLYSQEIDETVGFQDPGEHRR